MKAIYFPFTFISKPIVDALSACFKKTAVYQITKRNIPEKMKKWDTSGKIEIRIPVEGNEDKIEKILKDYKAWADLHQGSELSILKTQAGKIPFFNENSISQITSDIKKSDPEKHSPEKPDISLNARLFLQIAQEYDSQADILRQDLQLFDTMEQNLIKNLKGENEYFPVEMGRNQEFEIDSPGNYMTKE